MVPFPEYDFVFWTPLASAPVPAEVSARGRAAGVGDAPGGDAAAVVEFDGPAAAGDEQAVIEARLGGHRDKAEPEPLRELATTAPAR